SERNEVIRMLADSPDLTQEMIASMMDISQSTVSNVLRG
ncbi:MAG: helix-turn-helix domain-containing protein, partial [Lachnospiraceae bacterium]|nr:helix-turn-helix domain-containing protein [Lachnospiraceae bacterium]